MQLIYRGIPYTPNKATIETTDAGISATFRGQTYNIRRPAFFNAPYSRNLVYRGVHNCWVAPQIDVRIRSRSSRNL